MSDPEVTSFVRSYMHEVKRTLHPVPGIDLDEYIETLVSRFGNPMIADTLDRLSMDGSGKFKATLLPPLLELKEKGVDVQKCADGISLALAGYLKYYGEKDDTVPDPLKAELEASGKKMEADKTKANCLEFFTLVFGEFQWDDLVDNVLMWYMVLSDKGAKEGLLSFNEAAK